jgi:hypothetical protein
MNRFLAVAFILSVSAISACSSSDDDDGNTTGSGGGTASGSGGDSAGSSGSGGSATSSGGSGAAGKGGDTGGDGMCVNKGEINSTCPFNLPPITGSCAPHGECCYRTSNTAKIAALGPDEPAVLEYRLNYVDIINHPLTIGTPDLVRTANQRADVCAGEQCLLWRFTAPREGGQLKAGMGSVEIGVGAYNCDGTYSFYGPKAAPARADIGETDPGRWQSVTVPAEVDPTKEGIDRFHIPWVSNKNREISRSLFIWPADFTIDWELASTGFELTKFDTSEAGQDCMGARDRVKWTTADGFVSYSPLKGNDKDISNQTMQSYCSLLAFGVLPQAMKDKDCLTTPRCVRGTADCVWAKLPDSLCPETAEERAIFGCHLGDPANVNGEMGYPATLKCTPEKPTAALDPDQGATTDGQCCDPLGESTTLPACNAYRTVGQFVAAAAEITDAPIDNVAPKCQ